MSSYKQAAFPLPAGWNGLLHCEEWSGNDAEYRMDLRGDICIRPAPTTDAEKDGHGERGLETVLWYLMPIQRAA